MAGRSHAGIGEERAIWPSWVGTWLAVRPTLQRVSRKEHAHVVSRDRGERRVSAEVGVRMTSTLREGAGRDHGMLFDAPKVTKNEYVPTASRSTRGAKRWHFSSAKVI